MCAVLAANIPCCFHSLHFSSSHPHLCVGLFLFLCLDLFVFPCLSLSENLALLSFLCLSLCPFPCLDLSLCLCPWLVLCLCLVPGLDSCPCHGLSHGGPVRCDGVFPSALCHDGALSLHLCVGSPVLWAGLGLSGPGCCCALWSSSSPEIIY